MKKVFSIAILFLLPVLLHAYIGDENGFDWERWSRVEKLSFIHGFLLANAAIENNYIETVKKYGGTHDASLFYAYPDTVGDMVDKITMYYQGDPARLNHRLWRIIFWIYKKYISEDWQPGE